MRIARYQHKQRESYGIVEQQRLHCLPHLAKRLDKRLPLRMEDFIAVGKEALDIAETLQARIREDEGAALSGDEVSLMAPIFAPPKIVCLGLNYVDHAAESWKTVPREPIFFMKPRTAIIGPNENIVKPSFVRELDYEGELAIITGRRAKDVRASEAMEYVFGYTIFNDVSAREIQFGDQQWTRGKSFDTFAPMGPWITTKDQLPNTDDLSIRTRVNGQLRQNSSTRNMAFKISDIVHHLSSVMTLEPCDIIATGTPAGVGFAMRPPKFLARGDVVRIEIEGIGVLENAIA